MDLTKKTTQGISWSVISQVMRVLLQVVITAILARLLTPADFGLIAMVMVFTGFVVVFSDFGLTAALIQYKELNEEHLSSSFWINVLTGFFLTILLTASAPLIAHFYGKDRLTLIVIVLASTFLISSFGIVQTALFTKGINFKPLAVIEIWALAISGISAIFLAFTGFGVWSLVWQQVIFNLVKVILLWCFSGWRPRLFFCWKRVKELLGFGLNLTGFNFINYFYRNLDNLLIGKFLGSAPLGFYNLAYRLLLFPLTNISSVIGRVMFPALSTIQDDKPKVRDVYLRANRFIAMISFPMMLGLLILAPQFIPVVFGPQWKRCIFLVQILALIGLFQPIETTVGWIYGSLGRVDIEFHWGIFATAVTAVAFVIGLRWNVEGVTVAYAILSFLIAYPCFAIAFRLINLKFSHFIKNFSSITWAAFSMGAVMLGLRFFCKDILGANDLITLIVCVVMGMVSYAGFLFLFGRPLFQEFRKLLGQLTV